MFNSNYQKTDANFPKIKDKNFETDKYTLVEDSNKNLKMTKTYAKDPESKVKVINHIINNNLESNISYNNSDNDLKNKNIDDSQVTPIVKSNSYLK